MSILLAELPIWAIALAIFVMRVFDVTLGTVRTIAVVHGHTHWPTPTIQPTDWRATYKKK